MVDKAEGRDTIQGDTDELEGWALVNLVRFNLAKCKVLRLGQGNPRYAYKLGELIVSSPTEKDLRILVEEKFYVSQQCMLATQKANGVLGFITRGVNSRVRMVIVTFYSALLRLQLEYCIRVWGPQQGRMWSF